MSSGRGLSCICDRAVAGNTARYSWNQAAFEHLVQNGCSSAISWVTFAQLCQWSRLAHHAIPPAKTLEGLRRLLSPSAGVDTDDCAIVSKLHDRALFGFRAGSTVKRLSTCVR